MTDFSNICDILGELYANYEDDEHFSEFVEYNDLGLPLAYMVRENLATPSDEGTRYIMETWELFLASVGTTDTGFTDLNSLLESVE